jgi:hypothetical protein
MEATVVCVDNSEWTRNGDYAPTRFQVSVERECEMMCVRLAICIWARTPPPGRARLPFPPASARLFFARSLTFCILLFLFIRYAGPGRRGQPPGRREDTGQPGKCGGRADDGGQGPAGAGHADARPGASVERDAGAKRARGRMGGAPEAQARVSRRNDLVASSGGLIWERTAGAVSEKGGHERKRGHNPARRSDTRAPTLHLNLPRSSAPFIFTGRPRRGVRQPVLLRPGRPAGPQAPGQ